MKIYSSFLVLVIASIIVCSYSCIHDQMVANTTFHFYQDLSSNKPQYKLFTGRRLQSLTTAARDKLRIYADYTQILTGGVAESNVIKRVINISANYFYNTLKVDRLDILKFPANATTCGVLNVPLAYTTKGVIGDLGIIVGNQDNNQSYVARSQACVLLNATNRPMWGMVIFNNRNLGYTQVDFQRTVAVGIHQMTHVLGFSSSLYQKYPAGNPLYTIGDFQYLKTAKLLKQIQTQFNCTGSSTGLPLQDQDGTLISSHWQRKVVGNQFMIAISKKQAYVSRFTLALLDSTGWYDVNYTNAQPSGWGKNKGCAFLDVDICNTQQFCPVSADSTNLQLACDWDGTAYGGCLTDPLAGSCLITNYFSNTMCMDDSYDTRKLTSSYNAAQKGGSTSRCFNSTFKAVGAVPTIKLNYRCYNYVCASTFLYVKFNDYILICKTAGQEIVAPAGYQGILRCPVFKNYCTENKKTCTSNCNKNGYCINGVCLCAGSTNTTTSCIDQSNLTVSLGTTGGLTKSIIIDNGQSISLVNSNKKQNNIVVRNTNTIVLSTQRSINSKCIQGTFYDQEFGECVKCREIFGCDQCTPKGCLQCVLKNGGQCKVQYNNYSRK